MTEDRQDDSISRKWLVGGYLAPILAAAFTIGWALAIYGLIGNRSRTWQYAPGPYIPGESISTTRVVPAGPAPKQVELPSAMKGGMRGK